MSRPPCLGGCPCYPPRVARLSPVWLFAGVAGLCLAIRPEHLPAWDAIQMALGLDEFDMAMHQPHPPGYLAPMAVAWVVHALGLAADLAMQVQSVLATALATVAVFALGRRLGTPTEGVLAALVFAVHPVTLFYSVSGETYPAEALFAVLLVGAGLRVGPGVSPARLVAFFALFGLSGGVRQSLPLFFLPFAVWRLVAACRDGRRATRPLAIALASSLGGLAVWLVPLLGLAGGPGRLADLFGTQFFRVFGAHYSPLMGATGSAVLHNLDVFWRFVVEGLSASGLAAAVLLAVTHLRPLRGDGFGWVLAAWIAPAFLWFGLMFIYKSGHLLFLIPAFALASARVVARGVRSRGLARAVAGAAILAQAGLFLAPPAGWVLAVGGRSWPAIRHAETLTAETLQAVRGLALGHPDRVLVVTRDGRFDFRTAMYYLPEMRVVWTLDQESTGAARPGALACEAQAHRVHCSSGAGFWTGDAWPDEARVRLAPEVRHIAWFWDPAGRFREVARRVVPVRDVPAGQIATLEVTDLDRVTGSGFRLGPYRFVRGGPGDPEGEGRR